MKTNKRPVLIYSKAITPDCKVYGMVTPDGTDWNISIVQGAEITTRFVSTIQAKPCNGATHVSRMLRQQFGITGKFQTN